MRRQATEGPIIAIEWRRESAIDELYVHACHMPKQQLIEIAKALGRLAAKRDIARMKGGDRLSSDVKDIIVAEKEPA